VEGDGLFFVSILVTVQIAVFSAVVFILGDFNHGFRGHAIHHVIVLDT
jgi:hypothetical protein